MERRLKANSFQEQIYRMKRLPFSTSEFLPTHRRRIKTEEMAIVFTAAPGGGGGQDLLSFLLRYIAIFHLDNLKNRINCTRTI